MSEPIEILMYQVGARCFASDVHDVRAIRHGITNREDALITSSALGDPFLGDRGLTVELDGVENTLVVDQVLGVRLVTDHELQRLPAIVDALVPSRALVGLAVLDDAPTLLIDLPTLIRETKRQ